jgi:hypothetical protein
MSKLSKLLRHPIRFWTDAYRKRTNQLTEKKSIGNNKVVKDKSPYQDFKFPLFGGVKSTDPVAVYFDGTESQLYQLKQWLAPLEALRIANLRVTIVCRTLDAFNWSVLNTPFTTVYCKTIDDLLRLYQINSFKCILYVNNAHRNFQSLINSRALHVHINHGESEKLSTFSNQTKAYDYVLVSGPAALEKYDRNLIKKDLSRYLPIGRPQIEHIAAVPHPFGNNDQTELTVLYAPTWEGSHEEMDYSSIITMGSALVHCLLETPGYRLIYRPHPNTGMRLAAYRDTNHYITQYVQQHPMGSLQDKCDINALFPHIDIAVFDNSAVAVDYLATKKPMVLTNWLHKDQTRVDLPTIAQAARLIDPSHLPQLPQLLANDVQHDPFAMPRRQAQAYYLGDFDATQRASTKQFVKTVLHICDECEILQKAMQPA